MTFVILYPLEIAKRLVALEGMTWEEVQNSTVTQKETRQACSLGIFDNSKIVECILTCYLGNYQSP